MAETMHTAHILVVDDDTRLRNLLHQFLSEQGFRVSTAESAADARKALKYIEFDLMVLDVMMPGETGVSLAASLQDSIDIPIIMLSAMAEPNDRIKGLEVGVDDYLVKPFEPRELVLRIQSVLRRRQREQAIKNNIHFGDFSFDPIRKQLLEHNTPVYLTSNEIALLTELAEHPGTPVSRETLANRALATTSERNVDVQINRLRKKIEPNPKQPIYIQTARGAGYVLLIG
jgi:two-component system phosphate regulon response regulator OmpR